MTLPLDDRILQALAPDRSDTITHVMIGASALGNGGLLALGVGLAALAGIRFGRPATARYLCAVGLGAAIMTLVLKQVFARARPEGVHLVAAGGYSFPSGHSMASAAVYLAFALVVARLRPSWAPAAWALAVLIALAVGVSRAYLGVHYPSDVIAGWSLGAALALGLSFLNPGTGPGVRA
jgi:undecaprenyl-diphosphatase